MNLSCCHMFLSLDRNVRKIQIKVKKCSNFIVRRFRWTPVLINLKHRQTVHAEEILICWLETVRESSHMGESLRNQTKSCCWCFVSIKKTIMALFVLLLNFCTANVLVGVQTGLNWFKGRFGHALTSLKVLFPPPSDSQPVVCWALSLFIYASGINEKPGMWPMSLMYQSVGCQWI